LLNKNLPEELIQHIVSYLPAGDLFSLCCSNLFAPCLRNSPWFFKRMSHHFAHLMYFSCLKSENLFTLCAIKPLLINNNFYFTIDQYYIPFFKTYSQNYISHTLPIFNLSLSPSTSEKEKHDTQNFFYLQEPFEPFLSFYNSLFLPYTQYLKFTQKSKAIYNKKPLSILKSMVVCHSDCLCSTVRFTPQFEPKTRQYYMY
jgi:hypothetical protein